MKRKYLKILFIAAVILALIGSGVAWYIISQRFDDTSSVKADFTISADSLLHEFGQNLDAANKKYTEKILQVKGIVNEVEPLDSEVNVKFVDTLSGNYLIFSFQDKGVDAAKKLKEGDLATIRASCSGGVHSDILELNYVSFKRAALIKD
ncbi:MAG: hypothetical protein JST95_01315 [Bacteroidetes bacterium]|nr:hypothetical protein [Bacteroidota bacterium]